MATRRIIAPGLMWNNENIQREYFYDQTVVLDENASREWDDAVCRYFERTA